MDWQALLLDLARRGGCTLNRNAVSDPQNDTRYAYKQNAICFAQMTTEHPQSLSFPLPGFQIGETPF